jgi:hypothetical protein
MLLNRIVLCQYDITYYYHAVLTWGPFFYFLSDMTSVENEVQPMVVMESSDVADGDGSMQTPAPPPAPSVAGDKNTTAQGLDLGSVYKQCSIARSAASTMSVTEISNGLCVTAPASTPKIGTLDWTGDDSVLKTFHGSRTTKNGRTVNECISISFDPRNLQCLGCETAHSIFHPLKPPVVIFTDQNFVPFLLAVRIIVLPLSASRIRR